MHHRLPPNARTLKRLRQAHRSTSRLRSGLDFYPVDFELVPNNFMMEIAVYGLPVRMPHWSFGVRYIHQLIRQGMGHSRIFEVMFPGDPCHAYLVNGNTLPENTLVTAHVLGHADFAKNNHLFAHFMEMAGGHILEQAAAHAHRIEEALSEHGQERVEAVLDAALALEPHIDINQRTASPPSIRHDPNTAEPTARGTSFQQRFHSLPGEKASAAAVRHAPSSTIPPQPEYDLLWFIAHYAPEMEGWERDIFLAVREESFYFYPVFACQIMNEGWASYWHARLLREADFLPQRPVSVRDQGAFRCGSSVCRRSQLALAVNPYHLGFSMWEHIIEKQGLDARRNLQGRRRLQFHSELPGRASWPKSWNCSCTKHSEDGDIKIADRDIHAIHEAILAPKFNYGAPRIAATSCTSTAALNSCMTIKTMAVDSILPVPSVCLNIRKRVAAPGLAQYGRRKR